MERAVPRLRVFAGPNGSGKSTIKRLLRPEWLGFYLNADEIDLAIHSAEGWIPPDAFPAFDLDLVNEFLLETEMLSGLSPADRRMHLSDAGGFAHGPATKGGYVSAAFADFLREILLANNETFSFETVMSHRSKVELMQAARAQGYRTYLYFIATEDPAINVNRVAKRVASGGHDVPSEKVRERYSRTLSLLPEAVLQSDRAYVFDNSADGARPQLVAEVTDASEIEIRLYAVPTWVDRALISKMRLESTTPD